MGQKSTRFPASVDEAFEDRFVGRCIRWEKDAYVPYYVLVYELAFFLRNDPSQSDIDRHIRRYTGVLEPSPHDWMKYARRYIDVSIRQGRLQRYGDPRYPIILGIRLTHYQNDFLSNSLRFPSTPPFVHVVSK